jgi:tRNA(Arg) A34 adenosine deaminase TadA
MDPGAPPTDPLPAPLREAIALAVASVESGGGPFGAVVTRAGVAIARGQNRVVPHADPTAHAEVEAIRAACRALGTHTLEGCELYASCEPCPMCLGAIHWARIERVHHACSRADAAAAGFDDELLHRELALPIGRRALSLVQEGRDQGLAAFRAWSAKSDRVPY